jgi:hypothetical protein
MGNDHSGFRRHRPHRAQPVPQAGQPGRTDRGVIDCPRIRLRRFRGTRRPCANRSRHTVPGIVLAPFPAIPSNRGVRRAPSFPTLHAALTWQPSLIPLPCREHLATTGPVAAFPHRYARRCRLTGALRALSRLPCRLERSPLAASTDIGKNRQP